MAVETASAPTAYDEWDDRRWRLTGATIALLVLTAALLAVTMGEKRSDLGALQARVANGEVSHVEIEGLPGAGGPEWQGEQPVTLHWDGAIDRYTQVLVLQGVDPQGTTGNGDRPYVTDDPAEMLRALNPGVEVSYADRSGEGWIVAGWRAPAAAGWLSLVAGSATFFLLVGGPQPWRATRWAWFWMGFPLWPLGVLAFLLLGGPLGLWRPAVGSRRLTGGWAFLISLVFLGGANAS